ncbi:MAG: hypothetical protein QOJ23_4439, partial [Actinomycetota bacterium]|nr:hypothetical protein [Actinomycetota bacterium]
MALHRRWSYVALFSTLAMLGVACSGGSSKEASKKADNTQAASPAPSTDASTPSADNSSATPTTAAAAPGSAAATPSSPSAPAANGSSPAGKAAANNAPAGKAGTSNAPASGAPKSSSAAAATPGAPAPGGAVPSPTPGKANYASDVGVSADTIRIGTINMTSATRSLGPALAGVQEQNLDAAVKYINRSGGV